MSGREQRHRVVIVGGGFGGLNAARSLRRAPVDVTLLDRRNFHLFQPLLYQVATGALSPANIAAPLRSILKRQSNARVLLGEAREIDLPGHRVGLRDGAWIPYDSLVVATGVRHGYFGHGDWESRAPGLKTVEDATEIRRRILLAFEAAERERDPARVAAWLTFVVVGGGPTGVELAGALAEVARDTLRHDFRAIDPTATRILLVEGAPRVLPSYPPELSVQAGRALERLGVTVVTGALVVDIRAGSVAWRQDEKVQAIATETLLWAAGVEASPLGAPLAAAAGGRVDRAGRVIVEPDLTLPGHPEVFVIGDLAHYAHRRAGGADTPLPGVAQVAIQQGRHVARLIAARLDNRAPTPFQYHDFGSMATIGRREAVVDLRGLRLTGQFAWLIWLFVHLMALVQFQNRLLVLTQWAWNYFTRNRSARLITGLGEERPGR